MRFRYLSLGAVAIGVVLVSSAAPAHADIVGSCEASGSWDIAGIDVDAKTESGPITIPRSDEVHWEGRVAAAEGEYNGSIGVDLPPPFGQVEIDNWSGEYGDNSNEGVEEYDFPSLVPAGVEFEVSGEHHDDQGDCTGTVIFEIDGGPFDSPVTPIALGGTAIMAILTGLALKPMFKRVG